MQQRNQSTVIAAICNRFINTEGRATQFTMEDEATALILAVEIAEKRSRIDPINTTNSEDIAKRLYDLANQWLNLPTHTNNIQQISVAGARVYKNCACELKHLADQILLDPQPSITNPKG
jgi:hypothetical protein